VITFVAPDVHGNLDLLAGLLQLAGVLDENLERSHREEIRTVQLGDLCNCVTSSVVDDQRCLDHVEQWFDVYLVGNHEHPHLGGPAFAGFWRDLVLHHRLRTLHAIGVLQPCLLVDGILLTHAGVTPEWALPTVEETEAYVRRWWRDDPAQAPVFSSIGRLRGGLSRTGGVLWSDWEEPKAPHLRQIFGHTVGDEVRHASFPDGDGWAVCLDLGGGKRSTRLAGAFIRDGEVDVLVHESDPAARAEIADVGLGRAGDPPSEEDTG
jgi:hypothetical protein